MSRRRKRLLVRLTVVLSSGLFLPSATCVSRVADTVGDGFNFVGSTGVLGGNSQTATAIGSGLEFLGGLFDLIGRVR